MVNIRQVVDDDEQEERQYLKRLRVPLPHTSSGCRWGRERESQAVSLHTYFLACWRESGISPSVNYLQEVGVSILSARKSRGWGPSINPLRSGRVVVYSLVR